jgi:hypothetical protein
MIGTALATIIAAGAMTGGQIASAHMGNKANAKAGNLEAQAAHEALDFARQQEDERKREWEAAQQRNYEIWQGRERNLQPYRQAGAASLGQLAQPIPGAGSLGALMG